ncbi:MAG: phosphonate ABC transporter, permease protein PhnE, partial [Mesorhizobium sp.]
MRTNSNWANVFYVVLLVLLVVFIFDNISNFLRRRMSRTIHDYNRIQAGQG